MKHEDEVLQSLGLLGRREALVRGLFGAGMLGLRSLATGIPAAVLLSPLSARAECTDKARAQYLILSASEAGDPINANVPGTYDAPEIAHSPDPLMAATALSLAGKATTAAKPWAELPQNILDRSCFFHHGTLTSAHPNHPKVLRAMGATKRSEMIMSVYAKHLATCLDTVQMAPVSLGAGRNPAEVVFYEGRSLPSLSPRGLRATLTNTAGPLTDLQKLRDADLDRLNAIFKEQGTNVQRAYLDRMARSQREARAISQQLLDSLSAITSDDAASQVAAAAILIKMNVTPVVTVHVPFGGDNHSDADLAKETRETVSGVATIALLFQKLTELGLADRVTFATMNVFGRTLSSKGTAGRDHLGNHHVTVMIGKQLKGGIVGGVAKNEKGADWKAVPIASATGAGGPGGDISFEDSLGAASKTLGAALGVPATVLDDQIEKGKIVTGALA